IQSKIMVSEDFGENWRIIGHGAQTWRTLSIWFTEEYVYWNMDAASAQAIWRIDRKNLHNQSPDNDFKEKVAELIGGSHWYTTWAKDVYGDDVIIMGQTVEGRKRDHSARVFLIKEFPDGRVKVN